MSDEKKQSYELQDDGKVILNLKHGKVQQIAVFDFEDGNLEFENATIDKLHRSKVVLAIGEDAETGIQTGNKIKSFSIKGRERDVQKKNEPVKPFGTKQFGDKTKAVVEWYFKWRPQEAYARYGVVLDDQGNPVIVHGKRKEQVIRENPATGLVELETFFVEKEDGMLATRATHMTFLKDEVVGGVGIDTEEETN